MPDECQKTLDMYLEEGTETFWWSDQQNDERIITLSFYSRKTTRGVFQQRVPRHPR